MKKLISLILIAALVFVFGSAFAPLVNVGEITPEALMILSGGFISLVFSFFPGLNTWYAAKPEKYKKYFMLGVLVVVTLGIIGGICLGLVASSNMTCEIKSFVDMAYFLALAIVGNQGIFKITVKTAEVKTLSAKAG